LRGNAAFRRLYLAQLLSQGGDWFLIVPLLGILLELSGGPFWGALALASDTILIAVCSLLASGIVDRVDRRKMLVTCDLASAACVALAFLVRTPQTVFIALLAVGGVAAAKAFFAPVATAAVATLVPRDALLSATVISGATWAVMLVVGSSLSALVTALVGPYWCFGIDLLSFLCSATLVASLRELAGPPDTQQTARESPLRQLRTTLRSAGQDRRISALIAAKPATALGNGILAIFPALATSVFAIGPAGVGILFAARGIGALLGPLIAGRLLRPALLRVILAIAMILFASGYALFPLAVWFPLAVCCVVFAHIGGAAAASVSTYGLQSITQASDRGRVLSTDLMVQTAAIGLSQLGVVTLASLVGNSNACVVTACGVLLYVAFWWRASRPLKRFSP